MSLVVTSNPVAMSSRRALSTADHQLSTSLERLSSGKRINRAADGASELALSRTLSTQIGGLKVALRNTQDGLSVLQTAEGGLTETHAILHRMRDLTVQAANSGSLADDARANVQSELGQLRSELDRIAGTTTFSGKKLLDGTYSTTFQVGADRGETLAVSVGTAMGSAGLGVAGVDVTAAGAYAAEAGVGPPGAGGARISTAATTGTAAALTFGALGGTSFTGSTGDAYAGLDGTVSFGGRSFDLGSVDRDPTVDTDGNGAVDAADLLAQLNAAAQRALGLSSPPFSAPTAGTLRFAVADAVPGATGTAGSALGSSAADLARATPSFSPATGAARALDSIDAAIERVSTVRADIGAVQNRLEHNVARLGVALDNTAASESRIVDTDMAAEMTAFGRAQILTQASTAMLAQANASPQAVLKLLT